MFNFFRAVRLSLQHYLALIGVVVTSLIVAIVWGGNIGTVYPFIEVVFQGKSMHQWVDERLEEISVAEQKFRDELATLDAERPSADAARLKHIEQRASYLNVRLEAEKKARETTLLIKPYVQRYLPNDPFRTLVFVVTFVMVAALCKQVAQVLNMMFVEQISNLTVLDLRNQFYRHTLQMELSVFGKDRTGELMSRFTNDMGQVAAGLNTVYGKSLREPLKMFACFAGAAYVSWRLLLVSMLITPLAMVVMVKLARSLKRASRRGSEEMGELSNRLAESFTGIQAVKAYTMEPFERKRFHRVGRQLFLKAMRISMYNSLAKVNTELLGMGVICLALLAGGWLVLSQETTLFGITMSDRPFTFGSLMVFFAFLAGASDPARKLSDVVGFLQGAAAAADRIFPLLDRQPSIDDPAEPKRLPEHGCELSFEGIGFHYDTGPQVLKNINLRIPHGEAVAIVGQNGCGKSTLINLIPRFYDPVEGSVRFDGVDLRELRLRDLRGRISYVTQQTLLFDNSVLENIRYGSPWASDEQVVEAAKKAHAHDFIEALPEGYETNIGERGGRLSGGQRQRLALARAIIRDPYLLILDEATSQIDPESERLIHDALAEFVRDRTTIMITHRMSTLSLADRIVVMHEGQIADSGRHEELLTRCDLYRRIYQVDFRKAA